MSRLVLVGFFLVGLLLTASSAQDKDFKDKKDGPGPIKKDNTPPRPKSIPEPAIPGDCEIFFLNGSKVRMVLQSDKVEIATAYGKLTVPITQIRAIEFGLHLPDGVEPKIEEAIKNLGSGDYRAREKADKTLFELGPYAYPALLEASRSKEAEMGNRAKEIVKRLQSKHPKKDLKVLAEDKVVTHHFTIVGRIQTTTVKAKTEYFGEVELALAKMRTLRAVGMVSGDMDLQVDASKYANAGQWMDTGFYVDGRSGILITARGMIDVWPQRGGQMMSGPQGFQSTQNGMQQFMGARKIVGVINNQQHCGLLFGKIGEDGEIFVVGDRYDAHPEAEGKIFLHIGPSQWNVPCAGNFDVQIRVKND